MRSTIGSGAPPVSAESVERTRPSRRLQASRTPSGLQVTVRPMRAEDTAFLVGTHHRAYREVVLAQFGMWDEPVQTRLCLASVREAPPEVVLLGRTRIGYVRVERTPRAWYLREVVVDPDYQGRGIGTWFLRTLLRDADVHRRIVRMQVLKANRARAWYERFGCREVGTTATHVKLRYDPPPGRVGARRRSGATG